MPTGPRDQASLRLISENSVFFIASKGVGACAVVSPSMTSNQRRSRSLYIRRERNALPIRVVVSSQAWWDRLQSTAARSPWSKCSTARCFSVNVAIDLCQDLGREVGPNWQQTVHASEFTHQQRRGHQYSPVGIENHRLPPLDAHQISRSLIGYYAGRSSEEAGSC